MTKIWKDLSIAGRIVIGIWALCLIALITFLIIRHNDNKTDTSTNNTNTPEVAQVYEPSIGTPLPADVKPNGSAAEVTATVDDKGQVAGASTATPSTTPTAAQIQEQMIAPNTGIDPKNPVAYENNDLKFKATLPPGTQVSENNTEIKFTSKTGALYYIVSVNNVGTENLQSIEAQLKNSLSASSISYATLPNSQTPSLNFTAKNYGQGTAVIANGKIYYLLGNNKYFSTFKI